MKKYKPLRVLVCGGRLKTLRRLGLDAGVMHCLVVHTLNTVSVRGARPITVIHGGANGIDSMAGRWADATKTPKEVYPITQEEWDRLGKSAGPTRNAFMLTKQPDLVLAFPGGNGTVDMVARARHAGVKVFEVPVV